MISQIMCCNFLLTDGLESDHVYVCVVIGQRNNQLKFFLNIKWIQNLSKRIDISVHFVYKVLSRQCQDWYYQSTLCIRWHQSLQSLYILTGSWSRFWFSRHAFACPRLCWLLISWLLPAPWLWFFDYVFVLFVMVNKALYNLHLYPYVHAWQVCINGNQSMEAKMHIEYRIMNQLFCSNIKPYTVFKKTSNYFEILQHFKGTFSLLPI